MNKKKIIVISAIALIIVVQFFLIDYFYETKQKQPVQFLILGKSVSDPEMILF